MSRRNSDPAAEIGCFVLGLMWAAGVALFALIYKTTQTSPEEQLLRLQPAGIWKWRIEPLECSHCGTVNESYHRKCYICGSNIKPPPEPEPQIQPDSDSNPELSHSRLDAVKDSKKLDIAMIYTIAFFALILFLLAIVAFGAQ